MGELRSTFKPESNEPGRLKVNMGNKEVEKEPAEGYVGRKFKQRDGGEEWEVFEENTITKGPLTGETMLRLKGEKGQTFNMPKSRLEEILKEDNGAWQIPQQVS